MEPKLNAVQPAPIQSYVIPEKVKPWAWLMLAHNLRGNVTQPLRQMSDQQLRHIAATIGLSAKFLPVLLASWLLPQLAGPGFWVGTVLPAIRAELDRRARPKRVWGSNSPIAKLKRLDLATVASRFTQLSGNGDRLKGLCPLHQERTGSFYVYQDRQKWCCYGACASGGDVVDLLDALAGQGKRL